MKKKNKRIYKAARIYSVILLIISLLIPIVVINTLISLKYEVEDMRVISTNYVIHMYDKVVINLWITMAICIISIVCIALLLHDNDKTE